MHFQTWNNGKYGRIWPVDDDVYSWKFTEIVNGCASEEDFQTSPVIASHFIGYCINNEPKGEGDIYTPFYTYYYNRCLETFRKQHKDDIKLIRDAKRLESLFLNEHAKEERQAFEDSKVLFEFDESKENAYSLLFFGYMDYLKEKMPRYFVFKEILVPQVFFWREFDKIAVMGFGVTELCLDQVLEWSLGRVFASDIILNGFSPKAEDMEQIKALYGDLVKPYEVSYIRFNTADKKKMAQYIYDKLRLDMKQRQFNNDMELQLIIEHAERWFNRIVENSEQKQNVDVYKRQLELCLRKIDENNKDEHKPFCNFNNEPLDDKNVVAGLDCYGYSAQPYYRLEDEEFEALMEAFNKWVDWNYPKKPLKHENEKQNSEDKKSNVDEEVTSSKNTPKSKREIKPEVNREKLANCFNAIFKGSGRNPDYFSMLVDDIESLTLRKDCDAVAWLIFENKTKCLVTTLRKFAPWCRYFYDCIGVSNTEKHNFSKKPIVSTALESKFYYLK